MRVAWLAFELFPLLDGRLGHPFHISEPIEMSKQTMNFLNTINLEQLRGGWVATITKADNGERVTVSDDSLPAVLERLADAVRLNLERGCCLVDDSEVTA